MFEGTTPVSEVLTKLHNITIDTETGTVQPEYENGVMTFDPTALGHVLPRLVGANQAAVNYSNAIDQNNRLHQEFRSRYFGEKSALEEYLLDNADDIASNHLEEIAEIFGINLKKTVEFVATIEVRGSVEVDAWVSDQDAIDDISFDDITISGLESSVDSIDLENIQTR